MSEQLVKVRKFFGKFPETIRMRGVSVEFNENGEAEVPKHVADFIATSLPHEYVLADENGEFPRMYTSEVEEQPKRREVSAEERDIRGELARLRVEVQQIPAMSEEIDRLTKGIEALAAENAELKTSLANATASPDAPVAPVAPAAPARRKAPATK